MAKFLFKASYVKKAYSFYSRLSFSKTLLVSGVFIVFLGLLFLFGGLFGKLRLISIETKDVLNFSNHELVEYKRKSLEKQAKLSRELQTERNRIAAEIIPVFTIKPLSSTPTIL